MIFYRIPGFTYRNQVKLGRVQIFNNWSPYLVEDNDNVWIGLEYFCNEVMIYGINPTGTCLILQLMN